MSFQLLCKGQLLPNLQSNRQGLGIRVCLLVRHRLRLPLYNGEPARMCAMLCCRLLQNPPHVSARSLLFLSLALSSLSPSALKLKSSMTNQCKDHHGEATDDCPYLSTRRCACPFPDTDRLIGFTSPTVPLKGDDLPCQATPTSLPRGLSSTIDDCPWQVPLTLADASQTICVTPTTCLLPANRETASLGSPHGIFQVRTVLAGGLACPVAAPPSPPFRATTPGPARRRKRRSPLLLHDMVGFPGFSILDTSASACSCFPVFLAGFLRFAKLVSYSSFLPWSWNVRHWEGEGGGGR